jgi:hypothetical protein
MPAQNPLDRQGEHRLVFNNKDCRHATSPIRKLVSPLRVPSITVALGALTRQ